MKKYVNHLISKGLDLPRTTIKNLVRGSVDDLNYCRTQGMPKCIVLPNMRVSAMEAQNIGNGAILEVMRMYKVFK